MKSKKFTYLVMAMIVLIVILGVILLITPNNLHGNDMQSIEKVINSIEDYENQSFEIIEIVDIVDYRVVGFLANNNPSFIQFYKNKSGNYEWTHVETNTDQSFAFFLVPITTENVNLIKLLVVTTEYNNVASLELEINGQVLEKNFNYNQKSVTLIDLPHADHYSFEYRYFDKNGNEMNF